MASIPGALVAFGILGTALASIFILRVMRAALATIARQCS